MQTTIDAFDKLSSAANSTASDIGLDHLDPPFSNHRFAEHGEAHIALMVEWVSRAAVVS